MARAAKKAAAADQAAAAAALAGEVAAQLTERLAEEVVAFDVHETLHWTRVVVLASAQNRIHLGTLRAGLAKWLKGRGLAVKPEGEEADTEWVLFDLGAVVVHLLTPTGRDYWDLDHLWEECPRIP